MVAVIRVPSARATLTSGAAAEKSRAVWPPRTAQLRIMAISASSLAATGGPATRSPVEYVTHTWSQPFTSTFSTCGSRRYPASGPRP